MAKVGVQPNLTHYLALQPAIIFVDEIDSFF